MASLPTHAQVVIIGGGIDLSVGSMMVLVASLGVLALNKMGVESTGVLVGALVTVVGGTLLGLLNGVVITESLFNYKGFGWTLVQAAGNNDIQLLLGCSVVAVLVVLVTQLISDVGYIFLNPRIRIS